MADRQRERTCIDCGRVDVIPARRVGDRCRACAYAAMRTLKRCARCAVEMVGKYRLRAQFCSRTCAGLSQTPRPSPLKGIKTGRPSWNAGKTGYRAGYRHSPETIEKIRLANSGERAPNWKGGVSSEDELARKGSAYRQWRLAVFERDDYTCQCCGARSAEGARVRIEADHIKPFALHHDLRYEVSNGRTLCSPCHRKTDTWGNGSRRDMSTATLEATGQTFREVADERRLAALEAA